LAAWSLTSNTQCSNTHLPGFVNHAGAIKSAGVDSILMYSVADHFVMAAWGKTQHADKDIVGAELAKSGERKLYWLSSFLLLPLARSFAPLTQTFLGDATGEFAKKTGLTFDLSGFGLGERSKRVAMVVEDGKVTYLGVEPAGGVTVSGAEAVLEFLRK